MATSTRSSSFPESQRDISRLRQTATDAASDLSSTVAVHTGKARGQLHELAGHVQEEGGQQLERVKESLNNLVGSTRGYVSDHPLLSLSAAFAVGLLLGISKRRRQPRN